MSEYRHGAHILFEIHLHLVWITKYRRPVLIGDVGTRVRDIIREICGQNDVQIIKGHVSKDHLHLFVSLPPQVTISRLVQQLKGKSAYKLLQVSGQRQAREINLQKLRVAAPVAGTVKHRVGVMEDVFGRQASGQAVLASLMSGHIC